MLCGWLPMLSCDPLAVPKFTRLLMEFMGVIGMGLMVRFCDAPWLEPWLLRAFYTEDGPMGLLGVTGITVGGLGFGI